MDERGRGEVIVAVDIGTTSTKSVAYDAACSALAEAQESYPLAAPQPDRAEQDPDTILAAVLSTLTDVIAAVEDRGQVAALALGASMHSLIAVGRDDRPLTAALTFADSRAAPQAEGLRDQVDWRALYVRTGTPLHASLPLAKLLWFRDQAPEIYARSAHWISIKEYVLFHLIGEYLVDHSVAAASGLLDIGRLDWDVDALNVTGVRRPQLSSLVPTRQVSHGLRAEVARRIGLAAGTPVVIGASDGVLANLGAGALGSGMAACTIGTSGAVRVALPEPHLDADARLFCNPLTETCWVVGGAINNGGLALRWLRDEVFSDLSDAARAAGRNPYDDLIDLAAAVPAGSEGLLVLPYLTGERAPQADPLATAVAFGLRRHHGRGHLVRAVLEGVAFQLASVAAALGELGIRPAEYRGTGGFARSPLWRQIVADVLGRPLRIPQRPEGSALGAALLARVALGIDPDLVAAARRVRIAETDEPVAEHVAVYQRLHPIFERLYQRLAPEFRSLAERLDDQGP